MSPGVWVAEGAEVDPDAVLSGPVCVGDYAKVEAGVSVHPSSLKAVADYFGVEAYDLLPDNGKAA